MRKHYFIQLLYTSLIQLLMAFAVLSFVLNFFVMSYLEDVIRRDDEKLVNLIQKSVDRQLLSMERVTKALVYNPTFTPYTLMDNPYKAVEARQTLKTIAVANPLMEAIGTSYYEDDYLLTNETSALKSRYFRILGFDADKLESRSLLEKGYVVNDDYVLFLVPMSTGLQSAPGYFFYVFDKKVLGNGLFPDSDEPGPSRFVSLIMPDGEILADTGPPPTEKRDDYFLTRFESKSTGMVYSFYTSRVLYENFTRQLLLLFILSMVLSILLGGVLVFFFSRMNYAPVKHLTEILNDVPKEGEGKGNEFEQIEKTLISFMKFSDNPSGLHEVEIRSRREDIARECINGQFKTREALVRELAEAEIDGNLNLFCFMRVLVGKSRGQAQVAANYATVRGSISCVNTQIDRNQILFLVNSASREDGEELIRAFKEEEEKDGQKEFTMGVGHFSDQPDLLAQSFLEATTALEYRLVRGMGKTIYYQSIPKPDKINLNHLKSLLIQMRQSMLGTDRNQISASVERIISLSSDLSLSGARYIYWNLIRVIREAMDSFSLSRDEQQLLNELNVSRLTEFETLDDLRTFILGWLDNISRLVHNRQPDKYEAICLRVKDYIGENSSDPQLSLTEVARHMGLSQGHLCRVFKECESKTILQVIKDVRYDLSCSLLRETEISVTEVVSQVGYSDAASFTREFKKRYGQTPGQYRNQFTSLRASG